MNLTENNDADQLDMDHYEHIVKPVSPEELEEKKVSQQTKNKN